MRVRFSLIAAAIGFVGAAAPAFADDASDVKSEMKEMKARLEAQDRKIHELEGKAPTQDEIAAAVSRYVDTTPSAVLVGGGGGADGSAGWPTGKHPFIKEGSNKMQFYLRNQTRYEWFHYSDHAKGVLGSPANTPHNPPRDRSGFEIERMYVGFEGTCFCDDISFKLELNFDADSSNGLEKNYAWMDWKYSGEHHVRAGSDKVPFTLQEQTSTGSLAFCDRNLLTKAFALDFDTGVELWGYIGDACCECPKQFLYKVMLSTGEGREDQAGSVFNTDAFDTYSDQLLASACLEYTFTCKDWGFDEVDSRPCDERCNLQASLGASGYYEDDNDSSHKAPGGLALRNPNDQLKRYGYNAWFRAQWNGWSLEAEFTGRSIDYTRKPDDTKETAPNQNDYGAELTLHYRFPESNWGVAAKAGIIWLDNNYDTVSFVSGSGATAVTHVQKISDTISEVGLAINYFFWDHANKVTLDATWVQDNSAVSSSSAGYLVGASKGVIIEDGLMFRLQWQMTL